MVLPRAVIFGEALIDLIQEADGPFTQFMEALANLVDFTESSQAFAQASTSRRPSGRSRISDEVACSQTMRFRSAS